MKWAGYISCMEEMKNAFNILVGKPEGKKEFGKLGRR
jgi:hypothetical protein